MTARDAYAAALQQLESMQNDPNQQSIAACWSAVDDFLSADIQELSQPRQEPSIAITTERAIDARIAQATAFNNTVQAYIADRATTGGQAA